ncbi:RING/U-box superfamily protein, putative [Theobroma cacao]|uniref:RING-type E3 ubiquitin transferase n=1 Tax=Theobroma cacao TaxID=3641 RepID=A0A061FJ88_THECC|nr:RING/U-box superfamily protein, putative [Theobroma cacao]
MVTGQEMSQSQNSSKQAGCCSSSTTSSAVSAELKLYQAFIFSVPIFFAFILLFMFYLFYLRRRRADWSSLRMRTALDNNNDLYMAELGLKKEVREMLPIIIYKETFSIRDAQCSVCLGDYQAEDKLQQIPACGHTFHMDCIDHWLANHTTCPLCRLSVLASPKASDKLPVIQAENGQESSHPENSNGSSVQPMSQSCEETHDVQPSEPTVGDARILQHNSEEQDCVDQGREFRNTRNETREHEGSRGISVHSSLMMPVFVMKCASHDFNLWLFSNLNNTELDTLPELGPSSSTVHSIWHRIYHFPRCKGVIGSVCHNELLMWAKQSITKLMLFLTFASLGFMQLLRAKDSMGKRMSVHFTWCLFYLWF